MRERNMRPVERTINDLISLLEDTKINYDIDQLDRHSHDFSDLLSELERLTDKIERESQSR
jgi:DNA invertase Pin-like site-specific DNA recombinase